MMRLPSSLPHGLTAQGVPAADATRLSALPPTAIMSAALPGYNPIQPLLGPVLANLPPGRAAFLTGHSILPVADLRPVPARPGRRPLLRGKRYVHEAHGTDHGPDAGARRTPLTLVASRDYPERSVPSLEPVTHE